MNVIAYLVKIKKLYKNIFFVLSLILSLLLIVLSINFYEFINNDVTYSCDLTQNIDYNVKIFPNSIFDNKTVLSSGTMYISKLVDDVNVQYSYTHNSEVNGALDVYYTVKATTLIVDSSEKDVANITKVPAIKKGEHILKDRQKINSDNKSASISDNVVVNYDTYVSEIEEFKKDIYRLSYSILLLDFKVDAIKHIAGESDVMVESTGSVKIPLDEDSFVITTDFDAGQKGTYTRYDPPKLYINYPLLIIGCSLLLLNTVLLYLNKRFYYKYGLKFPELAKLEKFFSEFKDVIFKSTDKPDFANKNRIFINEFSELSNLYYLTKEPIIYYKNEFDENIVRNYFLINHNGISYIFVLKT